MKTLQAHADYWAAHWWRILVAKYNVCRIVPAVKINKRLKTTAGRAWIDANPQYIDLSYELLQQYPDYFSQDTIPHELCHLIAFTVYEDSGHGPAWKNVMRSIGLEPTRCHSMINQVHESRKFK